MNSPSYYQGIGIEAIDVIEAFELGFNLGNVVKYVLRNGRKSRDSVDLLKAQYYLERAIKEKTEWVYREKSSV